MAVPLTVATLNINQRHNRWLSRRWLLVAQLHATGADIIALQQVGGFSRQAQWICQRLNGVRRREGKPPLAPVTLKHNIGSRVAILTHLPVNAIDSVDLGHNRKALRTNLHLSNEATVDVVTTDLHPVDYHVEERLEQVMRLMGWLEDARSAPAQIIMGDFCDSPQSLAVRRVKQAFDSAYERVHEFEPVATFPTPLGAIKRDPFCRDYILVASNIIVTDAKLTLNTPDATDDRLFPSTHAGVMANLLIQR